MVDAGDTGLILELGRSPREGNGSPLQYSCLENSMGEEPDKESDTTEQLHFRYSKFGGLCQACMYLHSRIKFIQIKTGRKNN